MKKLFSESSCKMNRMSSRSYSRAKSSVFLWFFRSVKIRPSSLPTIALSWFLLKLMKSGYELRP